MVGKNSLFSYFNSVFKRLLVYRSLTLAIKSFALILFFTSSSLSAAASKEIETFITTDRYGLAEDFKQVRAFVPIVDGKKLNFEEGKIWSKRKILKLSTHLLYKKIAADAPAKERGLLILALSRAFYGADGSIEKENKLRSIAYELLKGEGDEFEKQVRLLYAIADLVLTIRGMNNEEEEKDLYGFCENENFYTLLFYKEVTAGKELLNVGASSSYEKTLKLIEKKVTSILRS